MVSSKPGLDKGLTRIGPGRDQAETRLDQDRTRTRTGLDTDLKDMTKTRPVLNLDKRRTEEG